MAQTGLNNGESFAVLSFLVTEGISQFYRYEIKLKDPLARAISLGESATFILKQDGDQTPVDGILASFDEMQNSQGNVYYRAVPATYLAGDTALEIFREQRKLLTGIEFLDNAVTRVGQGLEAFSIGTQDSTFPGNDCSRVDQSHQMIDTVTLDMAKTYNHTIADKLIRRKKCRHLLLN